MPRTSNNAMAFEPSVAVFDACILYPFHIRNVVVETAVDRLVEARWTDESRAEWIRSRAANVPTGGRSWPELAGSGTAPLKCPTTANKCSFMEIVGGG
jgi:hypothetical protein